VTSADCYAPAAMPQREPVRENSPAGDPWLAFAYLISGVGLYGFLGWLVDRWLGTSFLVVIGILFGAVLGTYLTWVRFREEPDRPAAHPEDQPDDVTRQEKQ